MSSRAVDVWGSIASAARNLAKATSASTNHHTSSVLYESQTPNCTFPQPQPLRLDLDIGLDLATAEKISLAYFRAATQLKSDYEKRFQRVGAALISHPCSDAIRLQSLLHSACVSHYTRGLNTWIEQIKNYGVRILRARQILGNTDGHKQSRRSFSQHVISILENFFEHNAFPSRMEKCNLSTETGLKYTQVHIWFQNRRRRFRKEGKELKKSDPVLALPSDLETSVVALLGMHSGEECLNSSVAPPDAFSLIAPPHAFPSPYPPTCPYDPFPIDDGALKFATPWMRKPSVSARRLIDFDITQLTASFMEMSLVDETAVDTLQSCSRSSRASSRCLSDVIGFTTIPSRAPIPSMFRATFAASPIFSEAGGISVSSSQTTASASQAQKAAPRKIASLPKRMPTSASLAHRVPPMQRVSTTPSSTLNSRSPSTPSTIASSDSFAPATPLLPTKSRRPHQTSSRRMVAALPSRAQTQPTPYRRPPSVPQFTSVSSRTPSAGSSSGDSSSSGPDTPLSTPPSFCTPLPPSKSPHTLEPLSSFNSLFSESFVDDSSIEGLQLQLEPTMRIASYASS